MSKKIPFLQMFSMLSNWPELALGVEKWMIVAAAIDKTSRSAKVSVEGASGAGANLVLQVEEAISRAYGLTSVKLNCLSDVKRSEPVPEPAPVSSPAEQMPSEPLKPTEEMDAFARTEAIRAEALKQIRASGPAPSKGENKPNAKTIFGHVIKKRPIPIQDLELDMGMVVIEGDVFAVDTRN